jgi:hypothetical protein
MSVSKEFFTWVGIVGIPETKRIKLVKEVEVELIGFLFESGEEFVDPLYFFSLIVVRWKGSRRGEVFVGERSKIGRRRRRERWRSVEIGTVVMNWSWRPKLDGISKS